MHYWLVATILCLTLVAVYTVPRESFQPVWMGDVTVKGDQGLLNNPDLNRFTGFPGKK